MTSDRIDPELATELRCFESIKARLIENGLNGKWVCIVGDRLLGTFDLAEAAYERGVECTEIGRPFLLQQILAEESNNYDRARDDRT